jgi:asparagine synthase (glutamine-hydrolysing)
MFAFAIDDPRTGRLVVARDHIGIKPLYYAVPSEGDLVFASEPKALLDAGLITPSADTLPLVRYLTYGHSTGNACFFTGLNKLPPAHALTWTIDGAVSLQRYWHPLSAARRWEDAGPDDEEVDSLIVDAVRRNMIADVPVGVFLSGGLDSSLVAALMQKETGRTRSYSVGFGQADDERVKAALVARALGTEHIEMIVSAEDARRTLDQLITIYDEPFADAAGLPTYLMAQRAREDVTVVLTGEGGDELFGGYRRYVAEQAHARYALLPQSLREFVRDRAVPRSSRFRRLSSTLRALAEDDRRARYPTWTEIFNRSERRQLLGGVEPDPYDAYGPVVHELSSVDDDVTAMMAAEIQTWLVDGYLEKVDKATMATSLESRVPLLDPRLVELLLLAPRASKIEGATTKAQLRRIAARYLPAEIVRQPKTGFSPPTADWLRTTLRADVEDLGSPRGALAYLLDPIAVRRIVRAFIAGQPREGQVWALLVLERWGRRHLSGAQRATAPSEVVA